MPSQWGPECHLQGLEELPQGPGWRRCLREHAFLASQCLESAPHSPWPRESVSKLDLASPLHVDPWLSLSNTKRDISPGHPAERSRGTSLSPPPVPP